MKEQTGIEGFCRRVLYKFSGQKVIGFLISSAMILAVVTMSQYWEKPSDEIFLKAIEAIKMIAIALLSVKGLQNVVGIFGDRFGRNKHVGGEESETM